MAIRGNEGLFERCREQFAYGHVDWIRKFAGVSADKFLLGRLTHDGWVAPPSTLALRSFRSPTGRRLPILTWNDDWACAYHKAGVPEAVAVGAPWLYMLSVMGCPPVWTGDPAYRLDELRTPDIEVRPYLYVPLHSWEKDVLSMSHIVRLLSRHLPPSETSILLGWGDYLAMETRLSLMSHGYQVLCAGYRGGAVEPTSPLGDREPFLANLLRIFAAHTEVVSEVPGTALVYAASIGKQVRVGGELLPVRQYFLDNYNFSTGYSSLHDFEESIAVAERDPLWSVGHAGAMTADLELLPIRLGWNRRLDAREWASSFTWRQVP